MEINFNKEGNKLTNFEETLSEDILNLLYSMEQTSDWNRYLSKNVGRLFERKTQICNYFINSIIYSQFADN